MAAAGLLLIAVYFFRLTRPALRAGFSPDDCMNLYRGWYFPLRALFKANLLFFLPSDFIRPLPEAWYRAIYFFSGFRPAPFHAADLALMVANIFLVYSLARRLAGSRFAALATALLFAYQERWAPLYFDTGYIFDVMCGFFAFGALLFYIRIRQQGRTPRALEYAALAALFVSALNSKEIAAALPAAVALYEALYESRRSFRTAGAMAIVSAAFIIGRATALTANEAYRPQFTAGRFLETTGHFLNELAAHDWFGGAAAIAIAVALLAAAIALRSRTAIFAWGFTAATALPIAFVPPRGGPQYYIPLFGCALYAGSLLAMAGRQAKRTMALPYWTERAAAAAVLLAIGWPIYAHGKYVALRDVTSITIEAPVVMSISAGLRRLYPLPPHGARLLFLHDPIAPNLYDLLFIVRLTYRDRTIEVDRLSRMPRPPSARQMQIYDAVFNYGDSGVSQIPQPKLALEPRILRFFDPEWRPITTASPAKPGGRVIMLATGLGPTDPDVAPGDRFPRDPFAQVLASVAVTAGGAPAPVVNKLGQPGEEGIYRVDFVLPGTTSATAKIKISAAGYLSPAAELPVSR